MANHKRRRPKHQRAGCLMCKPQKDERVKGTGLGGYNCPDPVSAQRKLQESVDELLNVLADADLDISDDDDGR